MRVAPEIILTDDERAELVKLERSNVNQRPIVSSCQRPKVSSLSG